MREYNFRMERPYHLSYPFLFEYGEQLYMLPESAENRSLDVYRYTHFPTHHKTQLNGVRRSA